MPGLPISRAGKVMTIVNALEVPVEHRGYIALELDGLSDLALDIMYAAVERSQAYAQASSALIAGMGEALEEFRDTLFKR